MATRKRVATKPIEATLDDEPSIDDVERENMALEASPPPRPPPPKPTMPLWAWAAVAFGAYKMLGKRR